MKTLCLAALVSGVVSHNIHGILLVNGTETPEWKYVLDISGIYTHGPYDYPPGYQGYKLDPIIGADNPNITCGRSAFDSAPHTETIDILAGSEVGFRVSADGNGNRHEPYRASRGPNFWHAGPGIIYLSRAPNGDLLNYKGDGDWFKIAYAGPLDDTHWSLWPGVGDFNFTIPKTTPPGKYLMRIENFMPTASTGYLQFYVNCAFVDIIGSGGGTPTEFVRFPGTYQNDDPGFLVPDDQEYLGGRVPTDELKLMNYKPPGPAVWTG
ncbi:lytic polysaccharide monooxygenase [Canariomyces notabilis]|uniref:lytic cellulose monooxygenase (C4-dehydrogenating) n=1 Tax=Canariomyces notabilis TaxID=2074819 RepID=A0AAN6QBZ1_9PEZI|nr:lytic polysaccharide monooxygenase [Canariomyces arenarius]